MAEGRGVGKEEEDTRERKRRGEHRFKIFYQRRLDRKS